jgi:hypothetical protein
MVVDMTSSSQIVEIAERFFFGLNAKVEMVPVMALEDLRRRSFGRYISAEACEQFSTSC